MLLIPVMLLYIQPEGEEGEKAAKEDPSPPTDEEKAKSGEEGASGD